MLEPVQCLVAGEVMKKFYDETYMQRKSGFRGGLSLKNRWICLEFGYDYYQKYEFTNKVHIPQEENLNVRLTETENVINSISQRVPGRICQEQVSGSKEVLVKDCSTWVICYSFPDRAIWSNRMLRIAQEEPKQYEGGKDLRIDIQAAL